MKTEDCFKVGYILKPHGLKGQVTISLDPDFPLEQDSIRTIFIEINNRLVPFLISSLSIRGDKALAKFEDIDTPESAYGISKKTLFLPKALRPRSAKDEFYDDEVIGFEVHDETAGYIGKITEVSQAGPNKLLVLRRDDREILIPLNGPFIKKIHKSERTINVVLPDGFLDI